MRWARSRRQTVPVIADDFITVLGEDEVFVFGSNLAGRHVGGAARQAARDFGAAPGVGEGPTGQCYAFPTMDRHLRRRSMQELTGSRDVFYACAEQDWSRTYRMTPVGTGIAGYPVADMIALFADPPPNVALPASWVG